MTSNDELLLALEEGERWLSRVCHDPPAPKTEDLKQRIRLALNEQWLTEALDDQPPAELGHGVKSSLRAILESELPSEPHRSVAARSRSRIVRFYRWAGGVSAAAAAAAVILFAIVGPFGLDPGPLESSRAEAFEHYRDDAITESLAALAAEVSEVEFALGDVPISDELDNTFGDLLDSIDELMLEGSVGEDDWT